MDVIGNIHKDIGIESINIDLLSEEHLENFYFLLFNYL